MRLRAPRPLATHALRALLLTLTAGLAAACSGPDVVAPGQRAGRQLASAEREVVINDEVWVDRTVEETPADIPSAEDPAVASEPASDGPSRSLRAAALAPEPLIRVGIVYVDFAATSLRIGGRDADDVFTLRSGSASGPVLASGLKGEVVATRVPSGVTPQIRLTLPTGAVVTTTGAAVVVSQSGVVRIRRFTSDQSLYRGTAEVRLSANRAALVGINELPIEQYIKGVVPRELGPIAYPLLEAQKTQAVAARTFARRRMQFCPAARCTNGYHTVPTTADQVYGGLRGSTGVANEYPLSNQAVEETRGVVATHNGGLIEALYSSTSGGFTANSEDVFLNALPYLRGVPDHERGNALEHVPSLEVFRRHANPTSLRNHANGDYEADWSAFHRWYVDWTAEEMRQVVGRLQLPAGTTFIDPGVVYEVNVTERSNSGHVREMKFVTEKRGTLTARKDLVRSALRYVTYGATGAMTLNSLRSTMVFVRPVVDPKTKALVGFEAWGGGWGHGVGMNQTGAVGMAEKGKTFGQILAHYYQNVVLEQRW